MVVGDTLQDRGLVRCKRRGETGDLAIANLILQSRDLEIAPTGATVNNSDWGAGRALESNKN